MIANFLSASCGTLLIFSQHTFNPSYVVNNETWNAKDSAFRGSSFIKIPFWLKYFTGGIEYHHIHHMNSKIPNYNLRAYHEEVMNKSNIFDNIVTLSTVSLVRQYCNTVSLVEQFCNNNNSFSCGTIL